jgi:hypothetical protein
MAQFDLVVVQHLPLPTTLLSVSHMRGLMRMVQGASKVRMVQGASKVRMVQVDRLPRSVAYPPQDA